MTVWQPYDCDVYLRSQKRYFAAKGKAQFSSQSLRNDPKRLLGNKSSNIAKQSRSPTLACNWADVNCVRDGFHKVMTPLKITLLGFFSSCVLRSLIIQKCHWSLNKSRRPNRGKSPYRRSLLTTFILRIFLGYPTYYLISYPNQIYFLIA